jgi:hypothetical protein
MTERVVLVAFLLAVLWLLSVLSLCLAVKQDTIEAQRDRLDYDPGCDAFDLRHSGRNGRDA